MKLSPQHSKLKNLRIPTVVLQSGEDSFFSTEIICSLIERIRAETGLIITLSIGERSPADYQAFQEAGANRYLLKHETASVDIYNYLRPGCNLEKPSTMPANTEKTWF